MGSVKRLPDLIGEVREPTAPPDWRNARLGVLNDRTVVHAGAGRLEGSWHRQDSDEYLIVIRGRVRVEFQDSAVEADPGECVLINAFERHRVTVADDALLVALESVDANRLAH